MDKKKKNIIILVILCILLVLVGVFICIDLFSKNNSDNLIINNSGNANENNVLDDEVYDDFEDVTEEVNKQEDTINNTTYAEDNATSDDSEISNESNINDAEVTDEIVINDSDNTNYSEDDVVSYFENMENEVSESSTFKEKFKEYFVTVVDFIFYDGEIKGYTFGELSDTAKAKIISVALKIDSKIEEYVPGYKESISSTTGKIYTDIKEKLVTSYMDVSSAVCKNNEKECDKVKEIFGEVKDSCKIGWDFIKGLLKSGVTKLKDWYEIYSGK